MIGSLRGTLIERDLKGNVIIEVGGVGYNVQVTGPASASMGEVNSDVFLHVHTRVREDAITMFGFTTSEEKRCFEALIGTHGVGPAVGLGLLAMHSPAALRAIIATEDVTALSQVPGIGKKTAARLLVELQSKFEVDLDDELISITGANVSGRHSSARADVTAALGGLGYAADEIRSVLTLLPAEGAAEDLLRMALRELATAS